MDRDTLDRLCQLAQEQSSLITATQAAGLGVNRNALDNLVHRGWLRPERRNVYAVNGAPSSRWTPIVAAALAAGPNAVISHQTAAGIHDFDHIRAGDEVHLTLAEKDRRRLKDVLIHLSGPIAAPDYTIRRGVRLATPAQTVVDLASERTALPIAQVVDDCLVHRRFTIPELVECMSRQPTRRRGTSALLAIVNERSGMPVGDSMLEQRVIPSLTPLGPFEVQHQIVTDFGVIVVDVAWPWWKVAAEMDGRHVRWSSRSKFDKESRKLTWMAAHDWKVAHLTWSMTARECIREVLSVMPPHAFPEVRDRIELS